jgi:phosphate transport system permease protein
MIKKIKKNKASKSKIDKNVLLKKKFRLSEVIAEKVISGVAFLSIAFVVLIFLFVFRETLPIFNSDDHANKENKELQSENGDLKPESYGSDEELKPETYGEITEELKPETYGDVDVAVEDSSAKESEKDSSEIAEYNPDIATQQPEQAYKTFTSKKWLPVSDNPRYGFLPLIIGTLKVTIISILIAAPIAILAALFTSLFASRRMKEIIKPTIELLASFPSVVIGFFALMILASVFQDIFGYGSRLNSFVGGVAMALAAIPVIYTLTEDALSAVPKSYTEASLALGASKWQTAFYVVLPAATPGIFAAMLLGIGRVFGETMIALMATGNAAIVSANPFDSVRTLSATIGAEMAEVVFGDTHYSVLFLIGSLLFIFTFLLNAIAEFYIKGKLVKRIQGK